MAMLLLIASLLVALPAGSTSTEMATLTRENVIQLFGAIAKPFDESKEVLNNFTDSKVEQIIDKIKLIAPAIKAFHQTAHEVATEIPQHRSKSERTLSNLFDNLEQAQTLLRDLFQRCKDIRVSPLALDTEEVGGTRSDENESSSEEQVGSVHPPDSQSGEQLNVDIPSLTVNFDQGKLDALIGRLGRDTHIRITDAAQAFLTIAETIGQKHRNRFLNFAPKIQEVGSYIREILVNLQAVKEEAASLLQLSHALKASSFDRVNLAVGLAGTVNRNIKSLTCAEQ